ncbi:MAG: hypothetical protein F6K56_12200 [Moorea sp. SIO3G5]|nr:hypothetical protein [Moorena sp. SIO3G5]
MPTLLHQDFNQWCVTGRALPTRGEEAENQGKPFPKAPYATIIFNFLTFNLQLVNFGLKAVGHAARTATLREQPGINHTKPIQPSQLPLLPNSHHSKP